MASVRDVGRPATRPGGASNGAPARPSAPSTFESPREQGAGVVDRGALEFAGDDLADLGRARCDQHRRGERDGADDAVDAGAMGAPDGDLAPRGDAEAHAVTGGDRGHAARAASTSTARVGAGVVQYSGVADGMRPLPSPPQPMTLPAASSASV